MPFLNVRTRQYGVFAKALRLLGADIGCAAKDPSSRWHDVPATSEVEQLKKKSSIIISCGEAADDGKFHVHGEGGINGRMGHMVRTGDAMSTKAMLEQLEEQFPDYPPGEE